MLQVAECIYSFLSLSLLVGCTYCDGWFYVSAWLGHEVPRHVANHYVWVCLWGCFQMRLAFELVDWVKHWVGRLSIVGQYHLTSWGPEQNKEGWENWLSDRPVGLGYPSSALGTIGPQAFRLNWNLRCWLSSSQTFFFFYHITGFSGSLSCRQHIMEFLRFHDHMSQINLCMSYWFCWTLTSILILCGKYKLMFIFLQNLEIKFSVPVV